MARYFELLDEKSSKFWEVKTRSKTVTVRYGRIGTNGTKRDTEYESAANAKAAAQKLIDQKNQKGYKEIASTKPTTKKAVPKKRPKANSLKSISIEDLAGRISSGAIPCLSQFAKAHKKERFIGLAVETMCEMGYFILSADTEERIEKPLGERSYMASYIDKPYLTVGDIETNCQEWKYFHINYHSKSWQSKWKKTANEIIQLSKDCTSDEFDEFMGKFWHASVMAFEQVLESDAFKTLNKSPCFGTFIYEHHDVF